MIEVVIEVPKISTAAPASFLYKVLFNFNFGYFDTNGSLYNQCMAIIC